MLNEFPKLSFDDEKPVAPPLNPHPHPFGKPPFTAQELAYEAMRKVNSIIADVLKFEGSVKREFETFIKTDTENDQAFKQTVTEVFDAFTETIRVEVNNFEQSVENTYELFKNGMESDYAEFTHALENSYATFKEEIDKGILTFKQSVNNQISAQNETIAEAVVYMQTNIEASTRKIFNEKISDGTISTLLANMFGESVVYKGADTASNIKAKTGVNGDIWYASDEGVYYQSTAGGWISVGTGDKGYAEVAEARKDADSLDERLQIERTSMDRYVGLTNNTIPVIGNNKLTIPEKRQILLVGNGSRIAVESTQLLTDLPANTIDDGVNIVFTCDPQHALVYNLGESKFYLRSSGKVVYNDVVLYQPYYIGANGGLAKQLAFMVSRDAQNVIYNFDPRVYILDDGRFTISYDGNTAIIGYRGTMRIQSASFVVNLAPSAVAEALPEHTVVDESNNVQIRIPENTMLLFTLGEGLSLWSGSHSSQLGKIVLYHNYYRNDSGLIYQHYVSKYVMDNKTTIENMGIHSNVYAELHNGDIKRLAITHANDGSYTDVKTAGFYVYYNNARVSFNYELIAEQIPEHCTLNEDETVSIRITAANCLVYDVNEGVLKIRSCLNVPNTCIVLYVSYYLNDYGKLYDRYIQNIVSDASPSLANIKDNFNSAVITNDYGWREACERYAKTFKNTGDAESFIFFTDPHLCQGAGWESECQDYIKYLQKVYNSSPANFIVCGGDWLGNNDTMDEACFKLGYIDGFMRSMFKNYYPVLGNHDTNYQGITETGGAYATGELSTSAIKNLWFRDTQKSYYHFKGGISDCYVLDTQTDWVDAMTTYKWDQIKWLGDKLVKNDGAHSMIFLHIAVASTADNTYGQMCTHLGQMIEAYNNRQAISIGEYGFDFRNCKGHIDFVMSGHTHTDITLTLGGVPLIVTTQMREGNIPTFDLCLADYTNKKLILTRVGSGESREVSI